MKDWPAIIKDLLAEHDWLSVRELCRRAGVNRGTFIRFMRTGDIYASDLDAVLKVFKFRLAVVSKDGKNFECRPKPRQSVLVASPSLLVNGANAASSATVSARPVMISSAQRLVSAVTRQNTTKHDPAFSPNIGHA